MSNELIYELNNVKQAFGKRVVLDIDNFVMNKGEIIALLGPNGSGKSTLLNILAFLARPKEGKVSFLGQEDVYQNKNLTPVRQHVTLVHQQPIMLSGTVLYNVEYPLIARKVPSKQRREVAERYIFMLGMESFMYERAEKLSGGESQRIAIARAFSCMPEVILMDEPTASVDSNFRSHIEKLIRMANKEYNVSIIFTTHDPTQVSSLADRNIYLEMGKIAEYRNENIFYIKRDRMFFGGKLNIPDTCYKGDVCKISVDPRGVILNPYQNGGVFSGKIISLSEKGQEIKIMIKNEGILNIFINKNTFSEFRFTIEDNVTFSIKEEGIKNF